MFQNVLYYNLSCTLCFFLSVVQVSVTRAICLWLKKRWIDSWKVMIFDWGQILEVIFLALSLMCTSFSLVSLCDDAGVTLKIISMSTRLPRNQKSSFPATPAPHVLGWFVQDMSKQPKRIGPARKFQSISNIVKMRLANSQRACQVEFNTVKCPFLFIPMFQFKRSRRSRCFYGQMIMFSNTFSIFIFCKNANSIPSEMNTVNYYPTDNCGICTPFPDFHALILRLLTFPCPSPGPPVGVGMNIDIASIDMVSEVNMVSGSLSPLFFLFLKHEEDEW